jgi:hypothetical protein
MLEQVRLICHASNRVLQAQDEMLFDGIPSAPSKLFEVSTCEEEPKPQVHSRVRSFNGNPVWRRGLLSFLPDPFVALPSRSLNPSRDKVQIARTRTKTKVTKPRRTPDQRGVI